ncbi:hypothetical protein ACMZ6G_09365 [Klebsiella pneumoniae]
MAIENPSSCPHCGGENGFHTKEVVDFKQFYAWDGSFLEGQHTSGIRGGKAFYCCDCGRNITSRIISQEPLTIPNDTFYVLSLEIFLKGRYTGGIVDVGC